MNTQSHVAPEASLESQVLTPPAVSFARLMYWSVRRELWENRSIYIAPLAVAAVFLFGFLFSMVKLRMHGGWPTDPAQEHHVLALPYQFAAGLIMGTALIVGIFYSLDALYGERRDRSILFWKSLPVSDLTAVLSKTAFPIIILPLLSFAVTIATQFIMLLLSVAVFLGNGPDFTTLWTRASFFHVSLMLLYHLVTVHGLWYAPLYGWLFLVSAWAPRAPFIWAFLPPFVVCFVEKIAFNTSYFLAMLERRLIGPEASTFMVPGKSRMDMLAAIAPGQFWSVPGLWFGLAIAAAFLFAAVRLRRSRGPI